VYSCSFSATACFSSGAEVGALGQRVRVGAHGEVFHIFEERLERGRLLGQLSCDTRRWRRRWAGQHIGQVDAGIAAGAVDVGGEVEDLREQDDAVQVDALLFSRMSARTAERVVP
jgi:hypothetical protein